MLHHEAIPARALDLLRKLSRCPVDLDWFTETPFDPEELTAELPAELTREILGSARNTLNIRLDGVKVDFLRYAYPRLRPPVEVEGLRLFDVADIAAMKVAAVTNRGARKDFYDLAFLIEAHGLQQLLGWYREKFPEFDLFPVVKSLTWFADAEREPDPEMLRPTSWAKAKRLIQASVASLRN